jgi:hypothetical protein
MFALEQMKIRLAIVALLLSAPCCAQYVVTGLSAPLSFNNVQIKDNVTGGADYAHTITGDGNIVTFHGHKELIGSSLAHTFTISTNGNNNQAVDPGFLAANVSLVSINNNTATYTYAGTGTMPYTDDDGTNNTNDSNPSTVCAFGHWRQFWRRSDNSNQSTTSAPYYAIWWRTSTSDCMTYPISWGTSSELAKDRANDCAHGTVICDYRVPIANVLPNGNIFLTWFKTSYGGGSTAGTLPRFMIYNGTSWTADASFQPPRPSGVLTGNWCGPQNSGQGTAMPDGGWAINMSYAGTGSPSSPNFCLQVGATAFLVETRDNGKTWTPLTTIFSRLPTNEMGIAWVGGTDAIAFLRVPDKYNGCTAPCGALWLGISTNFGSSSTWTWGPSGIPLGGSDGHGTLTALSMISPQLQCSVASTNVGNGSAYNLPTSSCMLTYGRRYNTNTSYDDIDVLFFNPASVISSGSTYLATLTPIQIWHQNSYGIGLDGYQFPVLTSGTGASTSWNFIMWWNAAQYFSDPNLNTFQMTGVIKVTDQRITAGAQKR